MYAKRFFYLLTAGIALLLCGFGLAETIPLSTLPETVTLVGASKTLPLEPLLRKRPLLILVASHATSNVLIEAPEQLTRQGTVLHGEQILEVAAVADAPWLVKKLFIGAGLQDLLEQRNTRLRDSVPDIDHSAIVIDLDGDMATALKANDLGKMGYAAFLVREGDALELAYQGAIQDDSEIEINTAATHIADAVAGLLEENK